MRLIHVDRLEFSVFEPGEAFGNTKRRVQGRFMHDGRGYTLWIAGPVYERRYWQDSTVTTTLERAISAPSLRESVILPG